MLLIIDPQTKRAFPSLTTLNDVVFKDWTHGEERPLTVALADIIPQPPSSRTLEPRDLAGYLFRAALGVGFIPPVAGEYFLLFEAEQIVTQLPFDATAQDIEDALNDLTTIIAAGGVDVTGQDGYFIVQFREAGVRADIVGDPAALYPISLIDVGTGVTGEDGRRAVQVIRIIQNPGAFASLTIANDAADAVPTVVQVGGGGLNAKNRITLTGNPYDGQFSITINGTESALVAYNATQDAVKAILEAIPGVGVGSVGVFSEGVGKYLLGFQGDLANEAVTVDADGSGLRALPTLSTGAGGFSLANAVIDAFLGAETSTTVIFEIEATNPAGQREFLFRAESQRLVQPVAGPANTGPAPDGIVPFVMIGSDMRLLATIAGGKIQVRPAGGGDWQDAQVFLAD